MLHAAFCVSYTSTNCCNYNSRSKVGRGRILSAYKITITACIITVMLAGCSTASTNEQPSSNPSVSQPSASQLEEGTALIEDSEEVEKAENEATTDESEQAQATNASSETDDTTTPLPTVAPELTSTPELTYTKMYQLPEGFVYLDDVISNASYELRYFTEHNFVGEPIAGYNAPFAVGTEAMANALLKVSEEVEKQGYRIHIYDAYRPVKAVEQFIEWSKDAEDKEMKEEFYPNIDKSELFSLGYLSKKSAHSRGSTVDLTLVDNTTDKPLDMGGSYDLLDERSHYATILITKEQKENRKLLKQAMEQAGFKAYSKEWWHFVLVKEPYASTYFEFDIE